MKKIQNLYVKFEIPNTVEEFILKFYSNTDTFFNYISHETYFDKDCKRLQCAANKSRSFEDLYDLVTTYYPDTNFIDLFKIILNTRTDMNPKSRLYEYGRKYTFKLGACSVIERIVVRFNTRTPYWYDDILGWGSYDSQYSWEQLFNLAEIDKQKYNEIMKI